MIDIIATRKKIELEQKVKALEDELELWLKKSESDEKFEKHHTQIRALQSHFSGWHTKTRSLLNEYAAAETADKFFEHCENAEKTILSEHRLWDYFRSKFIQRNEDSFELFLKAADEFAWACYKPIREAASKNMSDGWQKEPPLVFFNSGVSPFSVSRNRTFQFEIIPDEDIKISPRDIINKLPIPIVGVPWHQINFLPQSPVIGHEVGHLVEDDFGLTERLEELLEEAFEDTAAESRKTAWRSWLGEIFADIYGCLAAGPAFAGTLIDYLIKNKEKIIFEEKKAPEWKRYPTIFLRIKIVLKTLEQMGFSEEVMDYKKLWENYAESKMSEFVDDIDLLVPKLLDGKFSRLNDKSIKDVFCFTTEMQEKVENVVSDLDKITPDSGTKIGSTDIIVIFAALRTAFERTPDEYYELEYDKAVLKHIEKNVFRSGVRSGEEKLSPAESENKLKQQQTMGEELFGLIFEQVRN